MARDVELDIIANDKTFAGTQGARRNLDKVDDGVKKLSKSSDDADRSVQRMSKSVEKSSSMMTTLGAKLLGGGGAIAALVALREVAMGLSGGIVFGIGAALTAVAIKAQSMTVGVQNAFAGLKSHVVETSVTMSSAFGPALVKIAGLARQTFDNFVPDLTIAFRKMAPAVQRFAGDFGKALGQLRPAIQPLADGFVKLLAATGPALQDAMTSIASGLKSIGDEVNRNPQAFADFVKDLGNLAEFALKAGAGLNSLANTFNQDLKMIWAEMQIGFGEITGNTDLQNEALARGQKAFQNLQGAVTPAAQSMATLSDGERVLAEQATAAADALRKQSQQVLANSDATIAMEQAIDDAAKSIHKGKNALDLNTQAGRDNQRALNSVASTTLAVRDASIAAGDASNVTAGKIRNGRKAWVDLQVQLGVNRTKANQLADALFGIPPTRKTTVTAATATASAAVESFQRRVDNLHGKTVYITTLTRSGGFNDNTSGRPAFSPPRAAGGPVTRGMTYWVGEQGPELFTAQTNGMISSTSRSRELMRGGAVGGGGMSLTVVAPNYVGPVDVLKRTLVDMARTGQLQGVLRTAGVRL